MVRIKFAPKDKDRITIIQGLRGAVPGLSHKSAVAAVNVGLINVPGEAVGDVIAAIKPYCTSVEYPVNDREVAEARLEHAFSSLEDRVATRVSNFLADILDKI